MANDETTDGYLIFKKVERALLISPTAEGRILALEELLDPQPTDSALAQFFEYWMGNGWWWVPPEDIGALTSAPIISEDGFLNDDGRWEPCNDGAIVYAHMNYAVEDPIQSWAEGRIVRFIASELVRE